MTELPGGTERDMLRHSYCERHRENGGVGGWARSHLKFAWVGSWVRGLLALLLRASYSHLPGPRGPPSSMEVN